MTTLIMTNNENIEPNLPVIASPLKALVKPIENIVQLVSVVETPVLVVAPVQTEEEEDLDLEDDEVSEDEVDDSSEEEEDEEIDDDIDSDNDEGYGEQSLEGFPLSREEEAREAEELARESGLGSTNEALAHVGSSSGKRVGQTVERYNDLLGQDSEAKQLYEGLTLEINTLRSMINSGIHKVVSVMGVTATPSAVEEARAVLENYLRQVIDRSAVHSEYRDAQEVGINDILITLQALGRPLYWGEQQQQQRFSNVNELKALVQGETDEK